MLVCNVSMRPRGRTLSNDIAEAAEASDAAISGSAIFATLVDDPASVGDLVDAYFGEILNEAASASDDASVGLAYGVAVDELMSATDTVDGSSIAISTRSAMIAGPWPVFVNPGASREANANGTMVNL